MSVLGTTVFQVPKLGETGFKIDQVNEAKIRQAQQQIQKEVSATGAEKAYMDNAMGLTGIYKQIADASFTAFREAAIQYEKTGSAADEAAMKAAAGQLTYSVTGGKSILGTAGDTYVTAKANGFKDVAISAEDASELYTGFVNRTGEVIVKDGVVMVKDGDAFVPATQSTYLQQSINLNNSFILPATIKQGTYVNTSAFVNEYKGAISAGESVADAKMRVLSLFENKVNDEDNRDFVADIITSYAVNKLRMVEDPSKISQEKYEEIQKLASDEKIMADAVSWYKAEVLNEVAPLWRATSTGGGGYGSGTEKDITFVKNVTIQKSGDLDADGNPTAAVDVSLDGYMGLPSSLQVKGQADPSTKQKYNIVGVGVIGNQLYVEKNVFDKSDRLDYDYAGESVTKVDKITPQEWEKFSPSAKALITQRMAENGYNVNDIIYGKKGGEKGELD